MTRHHGHTNGARPPALRAPYLDRRDLMRRIGGVAGITLATAVITPTSLSAIEGSHAASAKQGAILDEITVQGTDGPVMAIEAMPDPLPDDGAPVVLVCHDIRGLDAFARDVVLRLADAGFVAAATDLTHRMGYSPDIPEDDIVAGLPAVDITACVTDVHAILGNYGSVEYVNSTRFGVVGFGFGADIAWHLAAQTPGLKSLVPWGGHKPTIDLVRTVSSATFDIYPESALGHLPEDDPGTGFDPDVTSMDSSEERALAWSDTLLWLSENTI